MTNLNNVLLTHGENLICAQKQAKHADAARGIPLMTFYLVLQVVFGLISALFEIAIFLELFDSIKANVKNTLSAHLLGMGSLIILIAVHIMAKEHEDAKPIRFIRAMVFVFLPTFILGAGFIFSADIMAGLVDIFTPKNDRDASGPFLMGMYQDYILTSFGILFPIGMIGFTAICVYTTTTLTKWADINLKFINKLGGEAKAANAFMKEIEACQAKYSTHIDRIKRLANQYKRSDKTSANEIRCLLDNQTSIYDDLILQMELSPDVAPLSNSHFKELFGQTNHKPTLEILRKKRDELNALDEKTILSVLRA